MKKSIRFELNHESEEFEIINRKGTAFLKANGVPGDAIQAQMRILLGLIIRGRDFDNFQSTKTVITICLLVENNLVTVEVRKPVGKSSLREIDDLDKTIQLIRGGNGLFEHYINCIGASDKLKNDNMNDCELIKIAYETEADIDFYVDEDNILNLSAVKRFL